MKLKAIEREDLPYPGKILSTLESNTNLGYLLDEHNKMVVAVNMLLADLEHQKYLKSHI